MSAADSLPPAVHSHVHDLPGYVTWDTTGVVVQADSNGVVRAEHLSVQLVEVP